MPRYDPSKSKAVEEMLCRFKGREDTLLSAVEERFNINFSRHGVEHEEPATPRLLAVSAEKQFRFSSNQQQQHEPPEQVPATPRLLKAVQRQVLHHQENIKQLNRNDRKKLSEPDVYSKNIRSETLSSQKSSSSDADNIKQNPDKDSDHRDTSTCNKSPDSGKISAPKCRDKRRSISPLTMVATVPEYVFTSCVSTFYGK